MVLFATICQLSECIRVQLPMQETTLVHDQPPRSTQPGHPSMDRNNDYKPVGADALQLGSEGRYADTVL